MTEHDESSIGQLYPEGAAPAPMWVLNQEGRLINLAYCTDVQVEPKAHGFEGKAWRIVARPAGRHTTTLADFDTEQAAWNAMAQLAGSVGAIQIVM
jgi:hypothetical protein